MKLFAHGGHILQPDTPKGPLPAMERLFISANIIVIYRHLRGIDCASTFSQEGGKDRLQY